MQEFVAQNATEVVGVSDHTAEKYLLESNHVCQLQEIVVRPDVEFAVLLLADVWDDIQFYVLNVGRRKLVS